MKRITTASIAAATALTIVATPAMAAEGENTKVGSSEIYQTCKKLVGAASEEERAKMTEAKGSSTPEGICINSMVRNPETRGGVIALLTLVPLGLIGLLGAAAAATGAIPGVSLPAMPALPM